MSASTKKKLPRNEFHFYLQRVNKFSITKNKKKIIPRKRKYKESWQKYQFFYYIFIKTYAKLNIWFII